MLLIGFGHKARQGKNTAAVAVVNASPVDSHARLYAYADTLRAEVKRVIREAGSLEALITRGWFLGDDALKLGNFRQDLPAWVQVEDGKPRTLLQWWGTDYRRAQDPDYWVKRMAETLEREQPDVALITDVRFLNEVELIHKLGGYVVKVERTTKPDIVVPAHPSENELDGYTGWDFHIKAGTLADCHRQATAIYKKIAGKR